MSCCDNKYNGPFTKYSIIDAGKSIIKHFVDPTYNAFSSVEEKNKRISICDSCENKEEFLGKKRCKICLCFIEAKASLIDQICPHPNGDKWQK
jgi:hypothetical protein